MILIVMKKNADGMGLHFVKLLKAKQCAIICVDEMLNYLNEIEKDFHKGYFASDTNHWHEVKESLLKL